MTGVSTRAARIRGLANESRMIATPWSRMVRGLGLGQYPVDHDPAAAARIRQAFELVGTRVSDAHAYTRFSRLLSELILRVVDPADDLPRAAVERALGPILQAVRAEPNPYLRLMAGCILMDAFAKLELDRTLLVNDTVDVARETLAVVDLIEPNRIEDENNGRHGAYEKLSGFSAVFLAIGQSGLADRLVSGPRNYVREALDLLDDIPSPFFRGRGGSMLLSVVSLLGYGEYLVDGGRDHVARVLEHLDRADELGSPPAFPGAMTPAFPKVYPLLTMLNAIAMTGREELLSHRRDRLLEAKELMAAISSVERTHMGLYYLVGLHNLGRLHDQLPDLDSFVEQVVGQWEYVDPGADFFLNGIAYPYIIQTAALTNRMDLVTDRTIDRLVDSFADLDGTDADRVNRPYPLSYALTILGEIGAADRLFAANPRYGGSSAFAWVAERLSPDARAESGRFPLLNHALIGSALRLRGVGRGETELFASFRFPLHRG